MKSFVNFLIFLFLFLALIDFLNKEKKKKSRPIEIVVEKENTEVTQNESQKTYEDKNNVILKNLGEIDEGDIEMASDIIREFGLNPIIEPGISVPNSIVIDDYIDARKFIQFSDDNVKTIYLTEWDLKEDSLALRGYTTLWGKSVVVRAKRDFLEETIKHELGHTFGLEHCSDRTCIMAINNDQWESGDFCKECKKMILIN
jgi:hypothetical protein